MKEVGFVAPAVTKDGPGPGVFSPIRMRADPHNQPRRVGVEHRCSRVAFEAGHARPVFKQPAQSSNRSCPGPDKQQ